MNLLQGVPPVCWFHSTVVEPYQQTRKYSWNQDRNSWLLFGKGGSVNPYWTTNRNGNHRINLTTQFVSVWYQFPGGGQEWRAFANANQCSVPNIPRKLLSHAQGGKFSPFSCEDDWREASLKLGPDLYNNIRCIKSCRPTPQHLHY
jgi:hypothetical protein